MTNKVRDARHDSFGTTELDGKFVVVLFSRRPFILDGSVQLIGRFVQFREWVSKARDGIPTLRRHGASIKITS